MGGPDEEEVIEVQRLPRRRSIEEEEKIMSEEFSSASSTGITMGDSSSGNNVKSIASFKSSTANSLFTVPAGNTTLTPEERSTVSRRLSEPGAIAVATSGVQSYRNAQINGDEVSTLGPPPTLSRHSSRRLSLSLSRHSNDPIVATVVHHRRFQDKPETRDIPFWDLVRDKRILLILFFMLILALGIVLGLSIASAQGRMNDDIVPVLIAAPTNAPGVSAAPLPTSPTQDPIATRIPTTASLQDFLVSAFINTDVDTDSPQRKAYETLLPQDVLSVYSEERVLQMYACQVFRYTILDLEGLDLVELRDASSSGALRGRRLDVLNECSWPSIQCNNAQQVTAINLTSQKLVMTLPDELYLLTHLTTIDLYDNMVFGTLPSIFSTLPVLTTLRLEANALTGTIPTEFGAMKQLQVLGVSDNNLSGTIPIELGGVTNLRKYR